MDEAKKPGSNLLKKRAREDEEDDAPAGETEEPMSRSERKRHREKKRRSDVNKGFDNLMQLLLDIDPEVKADAEDRARKGHCKRTLGAHEDNLFSRVDLIGTAVNVLRRIHNENEANKKIIQELVGQRGGAASASAGVASVLVSSGGLGGSVNSAMDHHGAMGGDFSRFLHQDPRSAAALMDRNSLVQGVLHGQGFPYGRPGGQGGGFAGLDRFQTLPHGNHLLEAQQRQLLAGLGAGGMGSAARAAFLNQYSSGGGGESGMQRNVFLDGILQNTAAPIRGLGAQHQMQLGGGGGGVNNQQQQQQQRNFPGEVGHEERKDDADDGSSE